MKPKSDLECLGEIFNKLNQGFKVEWLDTKEMDFLNRFYGEEWRKKVDRILKEHKR